MENQSIMLYRKQILFESIHGNNNNAQYRKIFFQQVRIILQETN